MSSVTILASPPLSTLLFLSYPWFWRLRLYQHYYFYLIHYDAHICNVLGSLLIICTRGPDNMGLNLWKYGNILLLGLWRWFVTGLFLYFIFCFNVSVWLTRWWSWIVAFIWLYFFINKKRNKNIRPFSNFKESEICIHIYIKNPVSTSMKESVDSNSTLPHSSHYFKL